MDIGASRPESLSRLLSILHHNMVLLELGSSQTLNYIKLWVVAFALEIALDTNIS